MNNYGILLNTIPYNLKKKIRSLERYGQKINNITWSIMFNQTCLIENIMPKYCKFIFRITKNIIWIVATIRIEIGKLKAKRVNLRISEQVIVNLVNLVAIDRLFQKEWLIGM